MSLKKLKMKHTIYNYHSRLCVCMYDACAYLEKKFSDCNESLYPNIILPPEKQYVVKLSIQEGLNAL